jgi:hypothetical protein
MVNQGKVNRVLREAVAVLVEELGHKEAADMLETAAAQLRSVGERPKQSMVPKVQGRHRGRRA